MRVNRIGVTGVGSGMRRVVDRVVFLVFVVLAAGALLACGSAGQTSAPVATAGVAAGPTPTSPPESAVVDQQPACSSRPHGASLVPTDLGDRRFRIDVDLVNLGLPAGHLYRVDADGGATAIATFPPTHGGPDFVPDDMQTENHLCGNCDDAEDNDLDGAQDSDAECDPNQWPSP